MTKRLYRIGVEVAPMEGTLLPSDCGGAFVNVYLRAPGIIDAIKKAEAELLANCYRPVITYEAIELDLEDVEIFPRDKGYPGKKDLLKLLENGGVWYSPFECFPLNWDKSH